ncbi:MAG: anthranilate phosphoribosyltransferase [Candidatus Altiarchaeales archaeon]|nr:anthranilate phosphoribosyltransferase [Candidatus Altiarchaeales archaeon]
MIEPLIQKLVDKQDLTAEEAEKAMEFLMTAQTTDAQNAGFLIALRMKGETPLEIASMAKVMRKHASSIKPDVKGILVDTCGTGGDRKGTINVSSIAMFITAGAGIPVAKHGNRSVSSQCGSADVLEALGVKVDLPPEKVEKCIEENGVGFMFAPVFHTSMKNVMPARKQLGVRTVFNVLGPLTNPANAQGQIIGVFSESLTEKLAEVLKLLGVKRAFVVHGLEGLDEISISGETRISELHEGKIKNYAVKPEDFGLKRANIEEIKGSTKEENARILKDILSGREEGAKRDIAVLNAAAAIVAGGKAKNLKEGVQLAFKSIESGAALEKLNRLVEYSKKA